MAEDLTSAADHWKSYTGTRVNSNIDAEHHVSCNTWHEGDFYDDACEGSFNDHSIETGDQGLPAPTTPGFCWFVGWFHLCGFLWSLFPLLASLARNRQYAVYLCSQQSGPTHLATAWQLHHDTHPVLGSWWTSGSLKHLSGTLSLGWYIPCTKVRPGACTSQHDLCVAAPRVCRYVQKNGPVLCSSVSR